MDQVIGIDPGLKGGICILNKEKFLFYEIPRDKIDPSEVGVVELYNLLLETFNNNEKTLLLIEKQHAFPGQGVVSNSRIVGEYKSILTTALIARYNSGKIVAVLPISARIWQGTIYPPGLDKSLGKERSIIAFKQVFGEELPLTGTRKKVPHLGFIDAALIAKYGQLLHQQKEDAHE